MCSFYHSSIENMAYKKLDTHYLFFIFSFSLLVGVGNIARIIRHNINVEKWSVTLLLLLLE